MAPPNAAPDDAAYWTDPPPIIKPPPGAQHGKGGLFVGGNWVDIEDLTVSGKCGGDCSACPRSQSRNARKDNIVYDVVLIGAGCLGAAVARQLAKYNLSTLWLEAADDVSQGATKGNSGIVHAGYDDKPGTNRAKYCWKGNQLFAELDRDLGFGYQKNGSLVVAFNEQDMEHLKQLKKRGETNGVQYLRIVDQAELRKMEPHINPEAVGALYAREAGNVIPYVCITTNSYVYACLTFWAGIRHCSSGKCCGQRRGTQDSSRSPSPGIYGQRMEDFRAALGTRRIHADPRSGTVCRHHEHGGCSLCHGGYLVLFRV